MTRESSPYNHFSNHPTEIVDKKKLFPLFQNSSIFLEATNARLRGNQRHYQATA
ncbi:hypothetical protein VCSRO164_3492 [Vibrio cholerae]|nr:hypothetical protein VCSRO164_3492 [Vibrio cholerae]